MKQQEWDKRKKQYQKILSKAPAWAEAASAVCTTTGNETACYVLAPVLCHYVAWVLEETLRSGKKRVYFLARDGWQMYHIAKVFCERLPLPIECRYLYCSRYALRKAEYKIDRDRMYNYLCLDGLNVTLETVFQRAGIKEKEEQQKYAKLLAMENHLLEEGFAKQLSYRELQELKPRLKACEPFDERQRRRAEQAYANAIGYFTQEGLLDKEPYLLADSGWSGTLQQTIGRLLQSAGQNTAPEGCYFGLYELPAEADRTKYHTWYFSPEEGFSRKVSFNNNVFECICTSTEGMCVGYKRNEAGEYHPRLSAKENPNTALSTGLQHVFTAYAEYMAVNHREELETTICGIGRGPGKAADRAGFIKIAERLLSLFMGSPTQEEAERYGSFVFCDDVIGEENLHLAATLEKSEIKKNHLLGQAMRRFRLQDREKIFADDYAAAAEEALAEGNVKNSAWMEASVALAYPVTERKNPLHKTFGYCTELWRCKNVKRVRYFRKQMQARQNRRLRETREQA